MTRVVEFLFRTDERHTATHLSLLKHCLDDGKWQFVEIHPASNRDGIPGGPVRALTLRVNASQYAAILKEYDESTGNAKETNKPNLQRIFTKVCACVRRAVTTPAHPMVQSLLCDVKLSVNPVSHSAVVPYDVLLQENAQLRAENAQIPLLRAEIVELRARLDALEARTDANKTAADAAAPGS